MKSTLKFPNIHQQLSPWIAFYLFVIKSLCFLPPVLSQVLYIHIFSDKDLLAIITYCLFCQNLKVGFQRNLKLTKIHLKLIIIMGRNRVSDTTMLQSDYSQLSNLIFLWGF